MAADEQRSREARTAAEAALVRVVHHYGARPEFVVIGGLVPELLCADSAFRHAGTTDVDVQVDLEIACGAVNTRKLEHALRNAEFKPDAERIWRWTADTSTTKTIVKFELLADLDDQPAPSTTAFVECEQLGAANLRGTGFAARDIDIHTLQARIGGVLHNCRGQRHRTRRIPPRKDRSRALPTHTQRLVRHRLRSPPQQRGRRHRSSIAGTHQVQIGTRRTNPDRLEDLQANFADFHSQGPQAYANQMLVDHPELDAPTLLADAVIAVEEFCRLTEGPRPTGS